MPRGACLSRLRESYSVFRRPTDCNGDPAACLDVPQSAPRSSPAALPRWELHPYPTDRTDGKCWTGRPSCHEPGEKANTPTRETQTGPGHQGPAPATDQTPAASGHQIRQTNGTTPSWIPLVSGVQGRIHLAALSARSNVRSLRWYAEARPPPRRGRRPRGHEG